MNTKAGGFSLLTSHFSRHAASPQRGVSLLDSLVGVFLMLVIFLGIAAAFQLSVDVITNNKARAGAVALANERMEYIRSLAYASLGTSGGIPSGAIPQTETISLNGISYTRRTLIEYVDDAKDGTGASDSNGITADYKQVKVDLAWSSRAGTRHVTLAARVSPPTGLESAVSGGTLVINAVSSTGAALVGAQVQVVNASTTPTINETTYTNASGTVTLIGAPAASNYQITVSELGYSTAQTYSATAQNTNPSPANLTVTNAHTTTGTFAIDVLGSRSVNTWTQILTGTWTDTFADLSKIGTTTNADISDGVARLAGSSPYTSPGEVQSFTIGPSYLNKWKTFSWIDAEPPDTSIRYYVYDGPGTTLVPDAQLPGNSAGFTTSPVDLTGVSTSTYQAIRIDAILTTSSTTATPSIDSWSVGYDYGPQPLPSIAFTMQGAKTIGSGPNGTVYKYNNSGLTTNTSGVVSISNLEWDTYLITVNGTTTGYDIASSCASPQPESLSPGAMLSTNLYLAAHTQNSLLVDVRSAASGVLLSGSTVVVSRTGFAATSTSDGCGQTLFPSLMSSNSYTVQAGATGYATSTATNVSVGGASTKSMTI
ncbi:carboxypeptidase regulatory-like domain-containing protein [Candidatus Kaiserbacteria bacterium]|nr:carboxypeptidase regulatory-like domain-containing protein [Candidatus Kaiserbacteria bacterium]